MTLQIVGCEMEVFEDPFTREKSEGRARITKVVREGEVDGIIWADCWVMFDGETNEYYRTIAHL